MAKGKGLSPGSGGPSKGNSQKAKGAMNGVGVLFVDPQGNKRKGATVTPVGKRGRR